MRCTPAFLLLLFSSPLLAQNYYVPDNSPTSGTANSIPFGSSTLGSFSNCRMQVRATAAELGSIPNIITGLGFAAANNGSAHYATLQIVMDHIPATQSLSSTFANNLTANALTVLSVTDYTWNLTGGAWNEVGLEGLFPFNGVDDVVIDITTTGGTAPGGMRRETNQRLYAFSGSGPVGATGTLSNTGTKFEVSMLTGRTSSHGVGCAGTNGTPVHTLSGTGQVGMPMSFDVANAVPSGLGLFFVGLSNASPYPLDLSFLNMPGCFAYTDLLAGFGVVLDPSGSGSYPWTLPPTGVGFLFFSQYACLDPAANAFGFTTSNYGRVYVGN